MLFYAHQTIELYSPRFFDRNYNIYRTIHYIIYNHAAYSYRTIIAFPFSPVQYSQGNHESSFSSLLFPINSSMVAEVPEDIPSLLKTVPIVLKSILTSNQKEIFST